MVVVVGRPHRAPMGGDARMIRGLRSNQTALAVYAVVIGVTVLTGYLSAKAASEDARHQVEALAVRIAQDNREAQLRGCQRSRDDREDAIKGWTQARRARLATARNKDVPMRERLSAAAAAETYKDIIRGYRSRLVDCGEAFPPIRVRAVQNAIRERQA